MKLSNKTLLSLLSFFLISQLWAQTIVKSDYFQTDFEDISEHKNWVLNSGPKGKSCPNKWFFGVAGANNGTAGLFVSGDDGATCNYVASPVSVVSYRPLTLDEGDYVISFDWQAGGMFGMDGLYVCWVPATEEDRLKSVTSSFVQDFVPEYALNFGKDSLGLGQHIWNVAADTIHSDGTAHFLVVVWKNSVAGISAPAACIDNLFISKLNGCNRPSNLRVSLKGDEALFQWDGDADSYEVKCRNVDSKEWIEIDKITTKYVEVEGLYEGTVIFFVRAKCGDFYSPWISCDKFLFFTGSRCINYLDLNNKNCFIGNTQGPRGEAKVVDFGYLAKESRHTLHWDKNEYDPRTDGQLRTVPDGAIASVRLGNWNAGREGECVEFNYPVDTNTSAILVLNYAVVLQDPGHDFEAQPKFTLEVLYQDQPLDSYGCGVAYFTAGENTTGEGWNQTNGQNGLVCWKDWTTVAINLRDYHGKSLKVRLKTLDCDHGAHFGYAYFTLDCSDGKLKGLTCGENPVYKYEAPAGFLYRWYSASNPDVTLSTDRIFEISTDDNTVYNVDVIQPTNLQCYYTLSAIAEERWPRASAKYTIVGGCENKISFLNKSHVILVDPETSDTTITNQSCETFFWDFDDGTVSYDENPMHVFPNEGGTYNVTLTSGIVGGLCTDVATYTFTFPKVGTTRDTTNAVICFGEGYTLNGRTYFGDGCYSDTLVSIYGCDSILTLNLTVLPAPEDVILDDEYVCEDEEFIFDGKVITESGTYTATYKNVYGCDSIVKQTVFIQDALHLSFDSVYIACADDENIVIPYFLASGALDTCSVVLQYLGGLYDTISNVSIQDNVLFIPMPDSIIPNVYDLTLDFGPQACGQTGDMTKVSIYYSREVLVQRWNDVLAVRNEDYNGGGYKFVAFQWYKDGEPIMGATSSILYVPEGLDLSAEYSVLLTRLSDNVTTMSCAIDLNDLSSATSSEYIVMSTNSQSVEVEATSEAKLNVWSIAGVKVAEFNIFEGRNSITFDGLVGLYIFEFIDENNFQEIQQVVLGK